MGKNPTPAPGIPEYGNVGKVKGFDEGKTKPDDKTFQKYMEEAPSAQRTTAATPEEMMKTAKTTTPTYESLLSQIDTSQSNMSQIQSLLKDPNLKLKASQSRIVKNKLTDANNKIRSSAKQLGAKEIDKAKIPPRSSPIVKFISYVANSQDQIQQVKEQISALASSNKQISPADLLSAQVKLAQAQQALEYSSVLISKTLDGIKQTLNIQM